MARTLLSSGSSFETDIGYSRAVIDGDWIFVSGTTGFDYATMTIPDDVVAQCKQSMRNIARAVASRRVDGRRRARALHIAKA
jgi:enamine deaminase RidA (YjgF/YER057c/UK114 family)